MFWTIMMARSGVVYDLTVGMGLRVRRREELSTSMRFHCSVKALWNLPVP